MLSQEERNEIRYEVYAELAEIERQVCKHAGSYTYLCAIGGMPVFTHHPVGAVLRYIPHTDPADSCLAQTA